MKSTAITSLSRRAFLQSAAISAAAAGISPLAQAADAPSGKAQIVISLDLEMSAQYPRRDITQWNYEKGNLDDATKEYSVGAARLVKELGGVIHFFCVGRVLEQPSVEWLKEIAAGGHPVGNHTYDHVNLLARKPEETQFRFQRSPWLIEGMQTSEIIRQNIRLTTAALKARAGIAESGFRTPGGFAQGLSEREDMQQMLLDLGYKWVSSKYPAHDAGKPKEVPGEKVYQSIIEAQAAAQPFVYPSGLVELPMSPISDVNAFRSNYWKLEYFLKALRLGVERAIETRGVFVLLAHPSCLVVEDPNMESLRLLCTLAKEHADRAELVDLEAVYQRVKEKAK